MKRYFMIVTGRVQGVGFRYHSYDLARTLNLTGKVRNLSNGDVEIEVQGSDDAFNQFLKGILKGNGFIKVSDYSMKEIPVVPSEKTYKITS